MAANERPHFVFLDGTRGIAAVAVGWLHAAELFHLSYEPHHASLAVDFFFVLSGFVVAYAYDGKLASGMTFRDFAAKRLIRLYPLIFIGVLLGTIVALAAPSMNPDVTRHLAILCGSALLLFPLGTFLGMQPFPVNAPIWSLLFELIANGVYAAKRARFRARSPILWVALVLSALALLAVIYRNSTVEYVVFGGKLSLVLGLVRVCFPFLAGVLIYRYRLFVGRFAHFDWLLALTLIALLACPYFQLTPAYDSVCIIFLFPLIISIGANDVTNPLANALWRISGNLSYPFYLLHQPIVRVGAALYARGYLKGLTLEAAAAASIIVAVVVSYLFLLVYDIPLRRWLTAALTRSSKREISLESRS